MARKVLNLGDVKWITPRGTDCTATVTLEVELTGGRLSISGDIRRPGARDIDTGGQILATLRDVKWIKGPTVDLSKLLDIWARWHLNDMRPGCEHQRADNWDKRPIDPSKSLDSYGKHFPGQRSDSWNMLAWVTPKEHPAGLLGAPCPVCGYKYGTAWLKEEIPADVVAWFDSL